MHRVYLCALELGCTVFEDCLKNQFSDWRFGFVKKYQETMMVKFLLFIPDMQSCRFYLFIEDVRRLKTRLSLHKAF